MGPYEQNQHFAELRQKVCLYIHAVVLLRGLPSLEGKNKLFEGKKRKERLLSHLNDLGPNNCNKGNIVVPPGDNIHSYFRNHGYQKLLWSR